MENVKEVMENIAQKLEADPSKVEGVDQVIALQFTGSEAGRWIIDCTQKPPPVKLDESTAASVTITMDSADMVKMAGGELNPQMAFLSGKVKVDGDLGLAIKLGKILS